VTSQHRRTTAAMPSRSRRRLIVFSAVAVMAFVAMPVVFADRLNDRDVKSLIDRVNDERDRFEDQLDGKLKSSILRGPGGEVNVSRFLDDLQENIGKMKDRFKPEYAASAEVTAVLRQGSDIQRFMAKQPANYDGASEWKRFEASLTELATAYSVKLPLGETQTARRMNDREVKVIAEELANTAGRFKNDFDATLKVDKAVPPATRQAELKELDGLKSDAEKLANVVGEGRPSSGEAKALLDRTARVRTITAPRTLSPAAQKSWQGFETGLAKVAEAFGMPARLP